MQDNHKDYYTKLYQLCGNVLHESFFNDQQNLHYENHNFSDEFGVLIKQLENRIEYPLLINSLLDYQFALLNLVLGQYRQAFMSLRLFLESSLAAMYYSAKEVELRNWMKGSRDIHWSEIIDNDTGLFSRQFIRAFSNSDTLLQYASSYQNSARVIYRECSGYVHGDMLTRKNLPDTLQFSETTYNDWQVKTREAREIVVLAYCIRYLETLDQSSVTAIESIVLEELGHVSSVRDFFNMLGGI